MVPLRIVYQSGPDIASNQRLLPAWLYFAEHVEQIAHTFDVHRHRIAQIKEFADERAVSIFSEQFSSEFAPSS